MRDGPQVVVSDDEQRRNRSRRPVPPSTVRDLAPVLAIGGIVLSLAGWADVLLFYWPSRFGESEWEFGVISQTIDALPLPTLGMVLLAVALRAMSERRALAGIAVFACSLVALGLLGLLVIFALDVPVA